MSAHFLRLSVFLIALACGLAFWACVLVALTAVIGSLVQAIGVVLTIAAGIAWWFHRVEARRWL